MNILRKLRHPYIVQYLDYDIDKTKSNLFIVMEYCEGGGKFSHMVHNSTCTRDLTIVDLRQLMEKRKRNGQAIAEQLIWRVFSCIVSALKECHRHREGSVLKPILHRDIKPGNIFFDAKVRVLKLGGLQFFQLTSRILDECQTG